MSHSVTVTRTTTTTSTSAIILNTGYCKTTPGILKVAEVIIGAIIVALMLFFDDKYELKSSAFVRYTAVTFFIGSFLLLIGCLVSLSTGSIIAKTSYEFIFHGGAFIMYLLASVWLLVNLKDVDYSTKYYSSHVYSAILAVINTILYFVSAFLAYRSYKWP